MKVSPAHSEAGGPDPRCRTADVDAVSQTGDDEIARIDIGGRTYRLLCVDAVVARLVAEPAGVRSRVSYVAGEAAHFELDGHSYSLVAVPAPVAAKSTDERDPAALPSDVRELLTNRELQIVQLICLGFLTKQVADRLHISEFTVRSYLKTIYCKLGVRSRGAMVYRYAQAAALRVSGSETSSPRRRR